jgi:hypothetical protein
MFSRRLLSGVVPGVALLAGCGGSSSVATLNVGPAERAIAQSIRAEHGITAAVRCPAGVPLRTGQRFRCIAALGVGSYPVTVVELNAKGGISYLNKAPLQLLNSHVVELAITKSIKRERHLRATVTCPRSILQSQGIVFTCTATTRLGRGSFTVTETNGAGHVRFVGQ